MKMKILLKISLNKEVVQLKPSSRLLLLHLLDLALEAVLRQPSLSVHHRLLLPLV
jgi:hypothetical protein